MARVTPIGRPGKMLPLDPFRSIFRLMTSVRMAIMMVLAVAVTSLLGVIFPQAPDPVRLSDMAFDAWMEPQRARYGFLAEPMRRMELFTVFHSWWFVLQLALLALNLTIVSTDMSLDEKLSAIGSRM